ERRLAGLLLPALDAPVGRLIEGLVELAPHVVDDRGRRTGDARGAEGEREQAETDQIPHRSFLPGRKRLPRWPKLANKSTAAFHAAIQPARLARAAQGPAARAPRRGIEATDLARPLPRTRRERARERCGCARSMDARQCEFGKPRALP